MERFFHWLNKRDEPDHIRRYRTPDKTIPSRRFLGDPGTEMAGYSGTPLPKKLGIRDGHRVLVLFAPKGFEAGLGPLPDGVLLERDSKSKKPFDVALLFASSRAVLERSFASAAKKLHPSGGLWLAWPKKSSGLETDVTESLVRATGLASGMVDNKVCAIDETWSGLRFVVRVADRAKKR
jgi:hypothetical protein